MKHSTFSTLAMLVIGAFAAVPSLANTSATASNIALRMQITQHSSGPKFTPVHAELGQFGVTPSLAAHAEGDKWRIQAKNSQGKILYETTLRNGMQWQAESFNPISGAIEQVQTVRQNQGVLEVSLPYHADIAQIEVRPMRANQQLLSEKAAISLSRNDLQNLLSKTRQELATLARPAASATTIIETGPASARMDYVFIGDGYTAAEMEKWKSDAKKVIDGFMADPLFAANRGAMNVRRVDVASNQSGVDEIDKGIYRDTALDGEFGCYNMARLLCVNNSKVFNVVGSVLPPDARDVVVVISNSTRYGGSGGSVATLSMNAQSVEVALHEIGHTAFALADEYDYGTCDARSEPSEGNVSLKRDRSVKWGSKIAANTAVPTPLGNYPNGTVGVFQGAQYCTTGKYRPTENSRMRTLGYPWHAVNEDLVKKVFAKYTPNDGGVTQTGNLSAGGSAYAPSASPGYVQAGSGQFTLNLTGAANTNFNLYLFKWNGSAWAQVASSTKAGSSEAIVYNGSAGYYYAQIKSASGSGAYTLKYNFPKQAR